MQVKSKSPRYKISIKKTIFSFTVIFISEQKQLYVYK